MNDLLDRVMSKPENKPCCSKGCFHCCREPAYASRSQISYLLENMPVQDKLDLMKRVEEWVAKFLDNHFETIHRPGAYAYRAAMLWCPLLQNGLCSVYDRRPIECRLFFAQGDPNKCADDLLRPTQKFLESPSLINLVMQRYVSTMQDGDSDDYDHIGVLLAEEALCVKVESAARITIKRVGNSIAMILPKESC